MDWPKGVNRKGCANLLSVKNRKLQLMVISVYLVLYVAD